GAAREKIEQVLDRNLFVEAAAGTGKTRSLVDRMVAMIREGATSIDRLSAVTFTIKAAAQLSERFQLALEEARRREKDPAKRARLEAAIGGVGRWFFWAVYRFFRPPPPGSAPPAGGGSRACARARSG